MNIIILHTYVIILIPKYTVTLNHLNTPKTMHISNNPTNGSREKGSQFEQLQPLIVYFFLESHCHFTTKLLGTIKHLLI